MGHFKMIRLAACLSAIAWMLSSPLRAASGPSVYVACGVPAAGRPTIDQLLCIAEAIGVPKNPASRVVRRGFNSTFAEPTLEILHHLERRLSGNVRITLTMKMEISALDGQLLFYRTAFEDVPESSAISDDPLPAQAVDSSTAAPTLAESCPGEQRSLTSERMQCIASFLGIGEGKNGRHIVEDRKNSYTEPIWILTNTIEDTRCQGYGAYLEVAVVDAHVLRYGLLEDSCSSGPAPKRPIMRTMREW